MCTYPIIDHVMNIWSCTQDKQESMWITAESIRDDYPSVKNNKKIPPNHPPDDAGASLDQSRRKMEKKPICVKYTSKKPSKFFSLVDNGEGTKRGEPGGDLVSSTLQPKESRILGGGSNRQFLMLIEAGRSGEAPKDRSLLFLLAPRRDTPRRCYGKRSGLSKSSENPTQPDCSMPKKTPDCPSPKTSPEPPCKVRFRECPPLPKLPKLPKCPPPCPPPPAPPVPKCPVPPKCPPPCAPPQNSPKVPTSPPYVPPKQDCSSSKILTYGLIQLDYKLKNKTVPSRLFHRSCPVFLVPRRGVSLSSANFGSKGKSGKNEDNRSSKGCQKSKETKKNCSLKESVTDTCAKPKKSATDRCAKPTKSATDRCSRSKKRDTKRAKDCTKPAKSCPTGCAPKPRCPPLPPPPRRSKSRVKWTPPICPPPRLVRPSECPESSKQSGQANSEAKSTCPPPPPLPKPPCRPVCLCPCPPPPKIPPGSCPDVPSVDEPNSPSCPPPCPPKLPIPCPKDTSCESKPICPSKK